MIEIRSMVIKDYDGVYEMWINTSGMGLNTTDDSKEGIDRKLVESAVSALEEESINKVVLVAYAKNEIGNDL